MAISRVRLHQYETLTTKREQGLPRIIAPGGTTGTGPAYPLGITNTAGLVSTFVDTFESTTLDPARWRTSPAYTSSSFETNKAWAPQPPDTQSIEVVGGDVVLKVRRRQVAGMPSNLFMTGAEINTDGNVHPDRDPARVRYALPGGRRAVVEIRCFLTAGRGMWPAFWFLGLGENWPQQYAGEIDVFEVYGQKDAPQGYAKTNMHWHDPAYAATGNQGHLQSEINTFVPMLDTWRTVSLERTPQQIIMRFDGVERARYTKGVRVGNYEGAPLWDNPPPDYLWDDPFMMILTAGGGSGYSSLGWADAEIQDYDYRIDYVKAWEGP